jgi:hypothetical protein
MASRVPCLTDDPVLGLAAAVPTEWRVSGGAVADEGDGGWRSTAAARWRAGRAGSRCARRPLLSITCEVQMSRQAGSANVLSTSIVTTAWFNFLRQDRG